LARANFYPAGSVSSHKAGGNVSHAVSSQEKMAG
jgi:hypothetical protein